MNYKTHTLGGIGTGLIVSQYLVNNYVSDINTMSQVVLVSTCITIGCMAGSLFPDIDKSQSFIGNRTKVISKPIEFIFGHRGLFHAPLFNLFLIGLMILGISQYFGTGFDKTLNIPLIGWILNTFINFGLKPIVIQKLINSIVIGFGLGIFSHIFLDSLNGKGIPLLLPFKRKHYRIIGITMGGFAELGIDILMIVFFVYVLYANFKPLPI